MDSVGFLQSKKILLSPHEKASKFVELLEDVLDYLEGDLYFTEDEFKNLIQEDFIKIKEYLNEE